MIQNGAVMCCGFSLDDYSFQEPNDDVIRILKALQALQLVVFVAFECGLHCIGLFDTSGYAVSICFRLRKLTWMISGLGLVSRCWARCCKQCLASAKHLEQLVEDLELASANVPGATKYELLKQRTSKDSFPLGASRLHNLVQVGFIFGSC